MQDKILYHSIYCLKNSYHRIHTNKKYIQHRIYTKHHHYISNVKNSRFSVSGMVRKYEKKHKKIPSNNPNNLTKISTHISNFIPNKKFFVTVHYSINSNRKLITNK